MNINYFMNEAIKEAKFAFDNNWLTEIRQINQDIEGVIKNFFKLRFNFF